MKERRGGRWKEGRRKRMKGKEGGKRKEKKTWRFGMLHTG